MILGSLHAAAVIAGQVRTEIIVAGEFIAADASRDDEARQALADVIFDTGSPSHPVPVRWLEETLRAFPGCAVTATWRSPDVCAVSTRQGMFSISAFGAGELGARFRLLACAVFVHGWLSARWPVEFLARGTAEIQLGACLACPGAKEIVDMRIPFSMHIVDSSLTSPARQYPPASA